MDVKQRVIELCQKISKEGLVKGTWGNISIREGKKVYITPSGYPYDKMKEEDIIVIDLNGEIIEGFREPSSELKVHIAIYNERKDVNCVLHTHPVYSSIVSLVKDFIPPLIEDGVMICGERINVSKYGEPGSWELANNVLNALGTNNAVILKNHGLVTVGENENEALTASIVAEKTAQIYIEALKIGEISILSEEDAKKLREKYLKSYRQKG
jgi:L-fuculose-phosphate aldolase